MSRPTTSAREHGRRVVVVLVIRRKLFIFLLFVRDQVPNSVQQSQRGCDLLTVRLLLDSADFRPLRGQRQTTTRHFRRQFGEFVEMVAYGLGPNSVEIGFGEKHAYGMVSTSHAPPDSTVSIFLI